MAFFVCTKHLLCCAIVDVYSLVIKLARGDLILLFVLATHHHTTAYYTCVHVYRILGAKPDMNSGV